MIKALGLFLLGVMVASPTLAQEKVRLGSSSPVEPVYYLPAMAALEQGYWRQQGLEVEYVAFSSGRTLITAVAAGEIKIGITILSSKISATVRGMPLLIVSSLYPANDFTVWVRTDSPMKSPKDLKGARIGVVGLGGSAHAYGQVVVKALGLEKEVRFVSAGGPRETIALLRTGAVDAIMRGGFGLKNLRHQGVVRELIRFEDYRPKEWMEYITFAHKDLITTKPKVVRGIVKGIIQASNFVRDNPSWTVEKLKKENAYPEEIAKEAYAELKKGFTTDGRINKKGVQNVLEFMTEYGLIPRGKLPRLEELYTEEFIS